MISKTAAVRFRSPLLLPFLLCIAGWIATPAFALPVIPGASGYGMDTPAGRGGKVFRVTNLNDGGAGSLRECVQASGPRVCVFEVSGAIRLKSNLAVQHPKLTIAGQTAPAPGILLRDATLQINASDVLVQHIAVRVGDGPGGTKPDARDALKVGGEGGKVRNVVIDHASFSWGIDEVVEMWGDWSDVTISNSIISEPLHDSLHSKGPHGLSMLIAAGKGHARASLFGNLIAHGFGRNPRSGASEFVFVNNVVYNGGESEAMLFNDRKPTLNSIVGNVFIKGKDSREEARPIQLVGPAAVGVGTEIVRGTLVYLADNDASCATDDPWSVVENHSTLPRELLEALDAPAWPDGLEPLAAGRDAVLDAVLASAGTRPAERNGVDERIVRDVTQGTGRIINCVAANGTQRCQKNAGGWPEVAVNRRILELPSDLGGDDNGNGYTNLEEWLHAMAAEVEGRGASSGDQLPPSQHVAPPKPPTLN
jgi:hypothetical protein